MKKLNIIPFFCVLVLISIFFSGCEFSQKNVKSSKTSAPKVETRELTGIVVENSVDEKRLNIRELESEVVYTLDYVATSSITDKYGNEIDGDCVSQGEILKVAYNTANAKIVSAIVPDDVWEYTEVKKFSFDADENMMKLAGEKYQYSDMTYFGSKNGEVDAMQYSNQDILTVRGIGIKIYSVVQSKGHGYIRLKNYEGFIGGIAEVGDDGLMVQINKNMLITAPEGKYRLALCRKGRAAAKTVTVENDCETVVDFKDCEESANSIGELTFEIEPDGADLTINGTSVDYSNPISLYYGKYKVVVSLTGYASYVGILNVEEASKTLHIELEEADSSVGSNTSEATASPEATATASASSDSSSSSSSSSDSTTTKKIDSEHTITVTAPEGAEVFLDNVYKGMAPCTFTKVIGSQTITLSETGYVTKSYSVDILDDGKNAKLSFADLVKAEDSTDE